MGVPSDAAVSPGDFVRQVTDVRSDVAQARTARRSQATSVGSGGSRYHSGGGITVQDGGGIRIEDGGSIRLIDDNDVTIAYLGRLSDGTFGWSFRYDSDDPLFTRQGTAGQQFWGFWDQNGNLIFTSDGDSGYGLGRPYLNYRIVPSADAQISGTSFWPSHTNTSFTKLLYGINPVWHPRVSVGVATNTSGGGTAHWRLLINGEDATGDISGSAVMNVDVPGWGTDITPGQAVGFDIEAYISGGTRVYVQCDRLYGLQS